MKLYKEGDKVKIVEYASAMWHNKSENNTELIARLRKTQPILSENANIIWFEMTPKLLGKTGVIDKVWETLIDDEIRGKYSIKPDWTADEAITKTSWYTHAQLELVCDHRWIERNGRFYCVKCKKKNDQK